MAERPDLERMLADLERRTRYASAHKLSDADLQQTLAYALALERAAAEAEHQRLAYANQVALATQALREEHAAQLSALSQELAAARTERDQWTHIAEQNQALLTRAIQKLGKAERQWDAVSAELANTKKKLSVALDGGEVKA